MTERVIVRGFGADRARALANADEQAGQWFGPDVQTRRMIDAVRVAEKTVGGDVLLWEVNACYERQPVLPESGRLAASRKAD